MFILGMICSVYGRFGFMYLATPNIEPARLVLSGEFICGCPPLHHDNQSGTTCLVACRLVAIRLHSFLINYNDIIPLSNLG